MSGPAFLVPSSATTVRATQPGDQSVGPLDGSAPEGGAAAALLRGAAVGAGLGLCWGLAARIWMRAITSTPGFSWAGTLGILGLASLLGAGVGLLAAARAAGRTWWWGLTVVPGLLLFLSPGLLFLPAFVLGGLVFSGRGPVARGVGALGPGRPDRRGGLARPGRLLRGRGIDAVRGGGVALLAWGLALGAGRCWRTPMTSGPDAPRPGAT